MSQKIGNYFPFGVRYLHLFSFSGTFSESTLCVNLALEASLCILQTDAYIWMWGKGYCCHVAFAAVFFIYERFIYFLFNFVQILWPSQDYWEKKEL